MCLYSYTLRDNLLQCKFCVLVSFSTVCQYKKILKDRTCNRLFNFTKDIASKSTYKLHVLIPEALYFITIQTEVHVFVDIVLNIHRHQRLNVAKIPPVKSRDNPRASRERIESIDQPTRGKGSMEQCSQSYPLSSRSSRLPDIDKSQPKMSSTQPVQNVSSVVENLSSEPLTPHISTKPSSFDGGKLNFVSNPHQQLSRFSWFSCRPFKL